MTNNDFTLLIEEFEDTKLKGYSESVYRRRTDNTQPC